MILSEEILLEAIQFVSDAHFRRSKTEEGRFRKGSLIGLPYFTHCIEVMKRLSVYGFNYNNESIIHDHITFVLIGGLGHDLIEDTDVSFEEIKEKWGEYVASLIGLVTRVSGDAATKTQKWEFLEQISKHKGIESIVLKIADRYVNVMDYAISDMKYAAKYALQAYTVFHAFNSHALKDNYGFGLSIDKDIAALDEIIKTRYNKSYLDMSYDEAKGLVT